MRPALLVIEACLGVEQSEDGVPGLMQVVGQTMLELGRANKWQFGNTRKPAREKEEEVSF